MISLFLLKKLQVIKRLGIVVPICLIELERKSYLVAIVKPPNYRRQAMAEKFSASVPKQNSLRDFKRQRHKSDSDYVVKKRVPPREAASSGDIYVTNKTNFKAQLLECTKKLEQGEEITLYGLGGAVTRAVNLALQIEERFGLTHVLDVTTSTLQLVGSKVGDLKKKLIQ